MFRTIASMWALLYMFSIGGSYATAAYAVLEALTGLLSAENALSAPKIDRRAVGWGVPLLYSAGYVVIPVATPSAAMEPMLIALLALRVWFVIVLWDRETVGVSTYKKLCDRGPYAFIRHPGMLSGLLARVGVTLVNPLAWNIAGLVVMTAAAVGVILIEEQFLREQPSWRRYAERVNYRLVPYLW
ncbi:methyltransferase family protein [Pseudobythopirellula maris]|nr:methyltransferase [Pseudobythopirellula maris]